VIWTHLAQDKAQFVNEATNHQSHRICIVCFTED